MIGATEADGLRAALPEAVAAGLQRASRYHEHKHPRRSDGEREGTRDGANAASASGRGSGSLIVVDGSRALAMRPDCRENHLHVAQSLYLATTWRMVQNALAAGAA